MRGFSTRKGFTLIEMAIVIVVVGLVIGVGVTTWLGLRQARQVAQTLSVMAQVRDCLEARVYRSEEYPTGDVAAELCSSSTRDFDVCLCESGVLDAWGQPLLLFIGVDGSGAALSGAVVAAAHRGIDERVRPGVLSTVTDARGLAVTDLAYVLLSRGPDGELCDGPGTTCNYATLFVGDDRVELVPDPAPDFQAAGDDVFLTVTSRSLLTSVLE